MPDVSQAGERIVTTVRTFVARSLAPLEARLAALETKPTVKVVLDQPQRPAATVKQVENSGHVGGRALADLQHEARIDHENLQNLHERVMALEARPAPAKGEDGKDGRDGVDGKDGERGADGIHGRDGVDGKDGERGEDGRSFTAEEIKALIEPLLELRFAAYVLEHERRLPDVLQRMIDKLEKPKDGRDGRDGKDGRDGVDGADGFDLRHFDVVQTDERTFTLRFKDLKREIKHPISLPVPIMRGIWRETESYRTGDVVTWGGSAFTKLTDEPGGKPEESAHWRLFVKRGRDGKDGERGEKGEPGKAGRNGRDLTQLGHDGSKW